MVHLGRRRRCWPLDRRLVAADGARTIVGLWRSCRLCLAPITSASPCSATGSTTIDRLISRTLVYGALTARSARAYLGLVLAGQAVLVVRGGSNLRSRPRRSWWRRCSCPLRSRVQRFVDRRFYRRRYDAQRTLEAFGARLREQVDLETLERDLRASSPRRCSRRTRPVAASGARREATLDMMARLGACVLTLVLYARRSRSRRSAASRQQPAGVWIAKIGLLLAFLGFGIVGRCSWPRVSLRNAVGWIFSAIGLLVAVSAGGRRGPGTPS